MPPILSRLIITSLGLLVLLISTPTHALAQAATTSFEELRLRVTPGEILYVTDSSGNRIKARLVSISPTTLTLARGRTALELTSARVARVQRRHPDSIKNGLLAGAGAGAAIGFLAGSSADGHGQCRLECGQGKLIGTIGGAFWGAVAGGLTDMLRHRQELLFEAPRDPAAD